MGLSQRQHVLEQDIHQISSTQQGALGLRAETKDGREFRYGLAGAVALAIGKLAQQPAVVTTHQNVVVSGSAGDMQVSVTLGATNNATVDQYKDGYLSGLSGTGAGQTVRIRTHGAITLSTTGTLYLAEPLTTTFAATPKASLTLNPYSGGLISTTADTTAQVIGVPIITITAAFYGWFQTKGIAAVLGNGTPAVGTGLIKSATTAGAVDTEATGTITQRVGQVYDTAAVSTSYITANLNIQV
jgi:hypothetical protein